MWMSEGQGRAIEMLKLLSIYLNVYLSVVLSFYIFLSFHIIFLHIYIICFSIYLPIHLQMYKCTYCHISYTWGHKKWPTFNENRTKWSRISFIGIILHVYHYIRMSFLTDPEVRQGIVGQGFLTPFWLKQRFFSKITLINFHASQIHIKLVKIWWGEKKLKKKTYIRVKVGVVILSSTLLLCT